jgi:hypothetical protein
MFFLIEVIRKNFLMTILDLRNLPLKNLGEFVTLIVTFTSL